jgi:hypothetical protein
VEINIGANKATLAKIAEQLSHAVETQGKNVELRFYWQHNGPAGEVIVTFSNDDMEDREDDFGADAVLVDVET